MLARDELRWVPWLPLLLAEGLYARVATARLPAARDPRGRTGPGAALRLAGLGDSIIAGIGVERQADGLVGQVAARIAARTGLPVEWHAIGAAGADSRTVAAALLAQALACEPQCVVLSVGVNDAVAGTAPDAFKDRLAVIVDALATSRARPAVVFGGIPPLDRFPALPWPLSRLLGDRSRALQAAAVTLTGYRGLKVVNFPDRLDPRGFAADGFHPAAAACATWAEWVMHGLVLALEDLGPAQRR